MVPGTERPCRFISYQFHLCKAGTESPNTLFLPFCARLLPGPSIPRGGFRVRHAAGVYHVAFPPPHTQAFFPPFRSFSVRGCKPGSRGGNPAPHKGGCKYQYTTSQSSRNTFTFLVVARKKKKGLEIVSDPLRPVASSHTPFSSFSPLLPTRRAQQTPWTISSGPPPGGLHRSG